MRGTGPGRCLHADRRSGRRDPAHDARANWSTWNKRSWATSTASCWRRSPNTCGSWAMNATSWKSFAMISKRSSGRFGEDRRTEISGEELGYIDLEDLITEETMVVSISHNGYIKRTPASTYRAQRRGGKGLKGARDRRRRSDRTPVCRQHPRLPAVLYQSRQGVLAEGVRSVRPWDGTAGASDCQPAATGSG